MTCKVQVLGRAWRILDVLQSAPGGQTLKSISAATGLHESTVHRIVNDMVEGRLAHAFGRGIYGAGERVK